MPQFQSVSILSRRARFAWLILLPVVAGICWPATPPSEYQVKAVVLFNFAQFVEWPRGAFQSPEAPFVIGVLGQDPFGPQLDDVVRGETVDKRPLAIRRYHDVGELQDCNILYIGRSEVRSLPQILTVLKGRSVLTVSDAPDADQTGVMIQLITDRNRIRMRIDVGAARSGNLTISSKLLRPAEIVGGGEH
jgi:hypothetical protein